MKSPIASFSGVKPSGRRGDGGRSVRVERAACCDDFNHDDEPCSAQRPRASARAAQVQPRRIAARPNARFRVRRKGALGRTAGHERSSASVARAERARCDARTDTRAGSGRRGVRPRTIAHLFARVANAVTAGRPGVDRSLRACKLPDYFFPTIDHYAIHQARLKGSPVAFLEQSSSRDSSDRTVA